VFNDVYVKVTG